VTDNHSELANGGAAVLICDDNPLLRQLLIAIVERAPGLYVAGEAADGNEAISEAARLQPAIILLDLAMPNRTGLEALPELRAISASTQIIVFSGFRESVVAEQAFALGADGYLEKGAPIDEILSVLERAIAPSRAAPVPDPDERKAEGSRRARLS
jgi:DNA-binding NarL/FixJ family response regulator